MEDQIPTVRATIWHVKVLSSDKSTWLEHSQELTWKSAAQIAKQLQKDTGLKTKVVSK